MSRHDWPSFAAVDGEEPQGPNGVDADGPLAAAYARCFATADGRRVLAHMRRQAFDRVCGPEASEALLRHAEGQRQFVAAILAFIRRGNGTAYDSSGSPDR